MTEGVPLVVPEINPGHMDTHPNIIANPNCSTIIMNMAVWPLHKVAPVERVVVSTYQAASGAGAAAMAELEQQAADFVAGQPYTQDIFGKQYMWNLFSHNSPVDMETGYCEEETKMIKETAKIFDEPDIRVGVTRVRVPVLRAHCEAINIEFKDGFSMTPEEAREILADFPGVSIVDDRASNSFPEPIKVSGGADVLVGRIRTDASQKPGKGLELFVAGDQLLKGAAQNAVQIAELLVSNAAAK